MVAHGAVRQVALFEETAFVTGGPADWSTNGTYFYITSIDVAGLAQASVANENNRVRPRGTHDNILTLRSGSSMSLSCHLHSNPTKAAEAAQATSFHLDTLLRAALGGRRLGWSEGVESSGAEASDELEVASDPGWEIGDWIRVHDTSEDTGYWHRIEAIAAGPPVTLTLDRDKEFTPDAGGADVVKAVIDCHIHAYATTQHDHANHKTLQILAQGDQTNDVVEAKGCKPTLSIEPFGAGQPLQISFDVAVTTFNGVDEATKDDFGSATPEGEAGLVPGIGTSTDVYIADVGSALAATRNRGQISMTPGPTYTPVEAIGGSSNEGMEGYVDDITQDTTLELMLPFSNTWSSKYRAQTHQHVLISVGESTDVVAFYFPELEIASEPQRNEEGALTGTSLSMRGHENSASEGALTGDALEKWRASFHILMVA